jgi:hypothetical protein
MKSPPESAFARDVAKYPKMLEGVNTSAAASRACWLVTYHRGQSRGPSITKARFW